MGIKKDAYLRDMVRIAAAMIPRAKQLWTEFIKPLILKHGENADAAVKEITENPQYKDLAIPLISKETIGTAIALSKVYKQDPNKPSEDDFQAFLRKREEDRGSLGVLPRTSEKEALEEPFISDLNSFLKNIKEKVDQSLYSIMVAGWLGIAGAQGAPPEKRVSIIDLILKDPALKKQIGDIVGTSYYTKQQKVDELYNIFNRLALKEEYLRYFRNAKTIDDKIEQGTFQTLSEYKEANKINKVLMGYLNSLDQRI